ncbi:hypothetical protein M2651_05815 [Clostridium sp. SYSU_GA19001]|uniref:hypothetical protein n=1 Tax=Clostridium caldaquaticum TaxID=2940653 RepID=UPI00207755EF|nr:hypothetical protein [Clostridium caldaquaticum]MCM8710542.1 hypothetical protein [Clostridium caldaquaticum]
MFKRYSNVNELLSTFNDFKDLTEYLLELLDKSMDEEIYEYYLHKSIFSDISYSDFKDKITKQMQAEKMTQKEVNEVMEEAFKYIVPRR